MNELSAIRESINELSYDIKAEVVIADLLENGFRPTDYLVVFDGLFGRRFKKDVSSAEILQLNNGQELLSIHITRDGLYDALPESLFHESAGENPSNGHEMAKISKTQSREEKETRTFFMPFEHEIFWQKVQLELSERKTLQKFSENLFHDIFPDFWNLDSSLPKALVSRLMLFLHHAHHMVGDCHLTAKALEAILQEPVTATIRNAAPSNTTNRDGDLQKPSTLGSALLGVDLLCGDKSEDTYSEMEFVIGPLSNTSIRDYLQNRPINRFLDSFFNYFVPLELIPVVRFKGDASRTEFVLDETKDLYLGYTTYL